MLPTEAAVLLLLLVNVRGWSHASLCWWCRTVLWHLLQATVLLSGRVWRACACAYGGGGGHALCLGTPRLRVTWLRSYSLYRVAVEANHTWTRHQRAPAPVCHRRGPTRSQLHGACAAYTAVLSSHPVLMSPSQCCTGKLPQWSWRAMLQAKAAVVLAEVGRDGVVQSVRVPSRWR